MMKKTSVKKALLTSALSLVLCFIMLLGTTFAWFTDEVISAENVIQSGTLDIAFEWADGKEEPENAAWKDASQGAIFNHKYWEPGYAEVRHVKISNNGTLALKYKLEIAANGVVSELADVIDVYYVHPAKKIENRGNIDSSARIGTLTEVLGNLNNTAEGNLKAGESIMLTLALRMQESAGNKYQTLAIGADFSIKLLATQYTYEEDSFDDQYDKIAEYPVSGASTEAEIVSAIANGGDKPTVYISAPITLTNELDLTDKSVVTFIGTNDEASVTYEKGITLTEPDAVLAFDGVDVNLEHVTVQNSDKTSGTVIFKNNTVIINGAINVGAANGKSNLVIENSSVNASTIFVGGHTMNAPESSASLSIKNSFISCLESSLGSTISIWGGNGVDAEILDSEIHTYSRGWHQSEDANDNSITFQGADHININIERSNMHLYGARSIINARRYGANADNCPINFNVDDSFIWVVTKSGHGEETLPVWGDPVITDSILLFTKNAYSQTAETTVKSFVYGNPVISGDYAITTQCGWETGIIVPDDGTVTIASDANISVYEGAAEVNLVLTGSAKVVVENGAQISGIGIIAADGYTLVSSTENGATVYTVN